MKLSVIAISVTVLLAVLSLILLYSGRSAVDGDKLPVNAEPIETILEETVSEKRRFVALVCDAVCPNAPYLCKVAFCSVILNRIESPYFPNTAAEVVMNDPMFREAHEINFDANPSKQALMAYDDALIGFSPCTDSLYYCTVETANMSLRKRQTLFQIGKYIFS